MRAAAAVLLVALAMPATAQSLTFVVTTRADAGAGSLRQALTDANARCDAATPCRIAFEIPGPLHLESALPVITTRGGLTIEGLTPSATPIVLDGSALLGGHGLEFRTEGHVTLRNLAIESFPGDGVNVTTTALGNFRIERLSVRRNRFRGLSVYAPRAFLTVNDSAFDENGYSGMALWAAGRTDVGGGSFSRNGASGIFLWHVQLYAQGGGSVMNGNVQFGLAMVPGRQGSLLLYNLEVRGNGVRNVDWGLDGESPRGSPHFPDPPELLSAKYDRATGITTVKGVLRTPAANYFAYDVGIVAGELETDGTVGRNYRREMTDRLFGVEDFPRPREIPFTFELRDAPPGTWVSAWGTEYIHYPYDGWVTELTRAVQVVE